MNHYTHSHNERQLIPATGGATEPERLAVCEVCGSADQVVLTAHPDRGGLQLCQNCRRLFGFDQVKGAANGKH